MQFVGETMSSAQRIKFAMFLIVYWIIGLSLAFWFGLGWLMLFETIQSLIFSIPRLYQLTLRLILGREIEEKEKMRMIEQGKNKVTPWKLAVRIVVSMGLTVLFFWKINVPIISFIRMIVN